MPRATVETTIFPFLYYIFTCGILRYTHSEKYSLSDYFAPHHSSYATSAYVESVVYYADEFRNTKNRGKKPLVSTKKLSNCKLVLFYVKHVVALSALLRDKDGDSFVTTCARSILKLSN